MNRDSSTSVTDTHVCLYRGLHSTGLPQYNFSIETGKHAEYQLVKTIRGIIDTFCNLHFVFAFRKNVFYTLS